MPTFAHQMKMSFGAMDNTSGMVRSCSVILAAVICNCTTCASDPDKLAFSLLTGITKPKLLKAGYTLSPTN
jgi:hypothetical protein